MAADLQLFTQRSVAVGSGALRRLEDDTVLHLPDVEVSFDLGLEEQVQMIKNPLAQTVTSGSYITSSQPTISLTYMSNRPEVLEMIFGRRFETVSNVQREIVKKLTIPASLTVDAAETGFLGQGVAANEEQTYAAMMGTNGMSLPMTRVDAAPAASGEFTLGANMQLQFHADDVGKTVSIITTATLPSALDLGEQPVGLYKGIFVVVLTGDNKTALIEFESASPVISGQSYDPGAGDFGITLRINHGLGECKGFSVTYPNLAVSC